jgi:hypothetical protein
MIPRVSDWAKEKSELREAGREVPRKQRLDLVDRVVSDA